MCPGEPIYKDIYELSPEEKANIKSTSGSLQEVLEALKKDTDFLFQGNVFTRDLLDAWISYKTKNNNFIMIFRFSLTRPKYSPVTRGEDVGPSSPSYLYLLMRRRLFPLLRGLPCSLV